jgi:hypothetical protein
VAFKQLKVININGKDVGEERFTGRRTEERW